MSDSWYYVEGNKKIGPILKDSLITLIQDGQLNGSTYVWTKGMENWVKLSTLDEFASLSLSQNSTNKDAQERSEMDTEEQDSSFEQDDTDSDQSELHLVEELDWDQIESDNRCIHILDSHDGNIYGPFSQGMIRELYEDHRVNDQTLIFVPKMRQWERLKDTPVFQNLTTSDNSGDEKENCNIPIPLVAKISTLDDTFEGICRDLSVGGMQILVPNFSGKIGDVVHFGLMDPNTFTYETKFDGLAKVDRILSGHQGIFVIFSNLDKHSEKLIENYLECKMSA